MRLFRIHLGAVALTNLADGVVAGALPLVAITLTRDPQLVALLSTALWLPWLLGALLVGVVVDRVDRARLRATALGVRVLVLVAALAVVLADRVTIWVLLALVLGYAVTEVFSDVASGAMVPQLVPRARLAWANSRLMGTERLMQVFLGQPLGGALVVLGVGWVFGVSGVLVLAAVVLVAVGLRRPEGFRVARERRPVLAEVAEGLRVVLRHRVVRPLVVMAAVSNLANTAYFAVFVLWVVGPGSRVGLQPWQFPLLITAISVGALVAAAMPARWLTAAGEVRTMLACWTLNTVLLLVPVLVPTWWAIGAAFLLIGATNMTGNVIVAGIRQRVVPAGLLGRVGGAGATLAYGMMALAGPLGGLVAARWGMPTLFLSMTAVALAAVLYAWTQVSQQLVDDHELPEEEVLPASARDRPDAVAAAAR